ncbi:Hypothetical predicted protein [Olea europaea subsp. europaea]|uniref:Uncharacterized protein n=1 Tax=Olea europaea subsp. europaea TaxID=158383 RepID=A0A8S0Q5P7_OLEEU|nr:Hypothetical predicted protein [Olea europaea subsp. europaea]
MRLFQMIKLRNGPPRPATAARRKPINYYRAAPPPPGPARAAPTGSRGRLGGELGLRSVSLMATFFIGGIPLRPFISVRVGPRGDSPASAPAPPRLGLASLLAPRAPRANENELQPSLRARNMS